MTRSSLRGLILFSVFYQHFCTSSLSPNIWPSGRRWRFLCRKATGPATLEDARRRRLTSPQTRQTRTVTMKVAFKTLCVPDAVARDPRPRSRAHAATRDVGARSFPPVFAPARVGRFVHDAAVAVPRIVATASPVSSRAFSVGADRDRRFRFSPARTPSSRWSSTRRSRSRTSRRRWRRRRAKPSRRWSSCTRGRC